MDVLIAQYSEPLFDDEILNDEDKLMLTSSKLGPSLKFALPPVAQVRFLPETDIS